MDNFDDDHFSHDSTLPRHLFVREIWKNYGATSPRILRPKRRTKTNVALVETKT